MLGRGVFQFADRVLCQLVAHNVIQQCARFSRRTHIRVIIRSKTAETAALVEVIQVSGRLLKNNNRSADIVKLTHRVLVYKTRVELVREYLPYQTVVHHVL